MAALLFLGSNADLHTLPKQFRNQINCEGTLIEAPVDYSLADKHFFIAFF